MQWQKKSGGGGWMKGMEAVDDKGMSGGGLGGGEEWMLMHLIQ
jgi:hypothetical protein